jgi:hypothetical protein
VFGRHAAQRLFCLVTCALSLAACGGEGDTRTGRTSAGGGSATGGVTNAGGSSSGSGSIGNAGTAGLTGTGGAPGPQCTTNFDCPQTNCFGCPPYVCMNGRCTILPSPSAGGASGSGGALTAGGRPAAGGTFASSGSSSGTGGTLPACGATPHLPQCEEYTRHTCIICNPGGCNESQLCYAQSSCDSLYARCTEHFACALAATTCAAFEACEKCQL